MGAFLFRAPGPSSRAFNSGAAKPQRTLIQQGAIDVLSDLKRPAGYLVDVIPWGAVVRTHTDDEGVAMLVDALAGRAPAIAVATGDRTTEPAGVGGLVGRSTIELLIYHASSHARSLQRGRQESDVTALANLRADPGLHVILEHAAELLVGQRCGASTAIKQIRADTEVELATTPAVTIWLQTYQITVVSRATEYRTAQQLLGSLAFDLGPTQPPGVDSTAVRLALTIDLPGGS